MKLLNKKKSKWVFSSKWVLLNLPLLVRNSILPRVFVVVVAKKKLD